MAPPTIPVITTLPETVDATPITITGTGQVGSIVELFNGNFSQGEETVPGSGNWQFTLIPLQEGSNKFTAVASIGVEYSESSSVTLIILDTSPSPTLPLYADSDRIRKDVAETGESNAVIEEKIARANEDASQEMAALFLNNFDSDLLEDWFIQITTEYATALFWVKSNGTQAALDQASGIYKKAERILIQRFQPVGSRVTGAY